MKTLRSTAIILQVSHTTVARWLKNPERKKYSRSSGNDKGRIVVEILVRTVILKCGFTIKKAKYFSKPDDLEDKVKAFIAKREVLKREKRTFYSIDETSFVSPKGNEMA